MVAICPATTGPPRGSSPPATHARSDRVCMANQAGGPHWCRLTARPARPIYHDVQASPTRQGACSAMQKPLGVVSMLHLGMKGNARMHGSRKGLLFFSLIYGVMQLCGCSTTSPVAPAQVELLKRTYDPNGVSLTIQLHGRISVENGCIFLVNPESNFHLLARFPSNYALWVRKGRAVGILEQDTGKRVAFDKPAKFGGGERVNIKNGDHCLGNGIDIEI